MECIAFAAPRGRDGGVIAQCPLKGIERLLVAFLLNEHQSLIVPGLRQAWINLERFVKGTERLFGLAQRAENSPLAIPSSSIVRF